MCSQRARRCPRRTASMQSFLDACAIRIADAEVAAPRTLHARCAERLEQLQTISRSKPGAAAASASATTASAETAHESLTKAGALLAQAVRTFYMLLQSDPVHSHVEGGERDLEKAVVTYDSWARALLSVVLPAARKSVGAACCMVLHGVVTFTERAKTPASLRAADVGPVEDAVKKLSELETSGGACTRRMLRESRSIIADALRELGESIAEVRDEAAGDDDDDDDDEPSLLANPAVASALEALLRGTVSSLDLAVAAVERPQATAVLTMLITCARAASTQVDTLVCAADEEDDLDVVRGHAASLSRVMLKLHQTLAKCALDDDAGRAAVQAGIEGASAALRDVP